MVQSDSGNSASGSDHRLYVRDPDTWAVRSKGDATQVYCHAKNPGEDYFHALIRGELYVYRDDEVYCLNCAERIGLITENRTHWKRR